MTSNYPQNQPYSGYAPAQSNKTNGLAIASLITSFFISIVGIILGHIALSQIKRTGENGRGLAIAGLVIGYVSLAIGIIAAISMLGIAANQM
jgi:peptidyl-prolyl cis-trans isomerase B (cyclophilin B)